MAATIRLRRMGRKKLPFYRIVVIDSRKKRDGEYIDNIGTYNPLVHPAEIVVNEEKAISWLQKGATPSDTVKSLLSHQGILLKLDLMKKGFSTEKISEELQKWQMMQTTRQERKAMKSEIESGEEKTTTPEETVEPSETTTPA